MIDLCKKTTTYYKIDLSKYIGKRKQGFSTVEKKLKLIFAVPTRFRSETQNLENMLKKHFCTKTTQTNTEHTQLTFSAHHSTSAW